jgi:hypothetical protein
MRCLVPIAFTGSIEMIENPTKLMGAVLFLGFSALVFMVVVGGFWWVTGQ